MTSSSQLVEKSIAAALAAIEIYNKPNFVYREESFSILMINAWELLLKAKFMADRADDPACLFEQRKNRSGNPITFGLTYLIETIRQEKQSGLSTNCCKNIYLLTEIRDNAIHFTNID
jgi:hypothetical protein